MKKNYKVLGTGLSLAVVVGLYGCGKKNSRKNQKHEDLLYEDMVMHGPEADGTYLAKFNGVNTNVISPSGSLTLAKDGDFFVADVRMSHSTPNIIHGQNIHAGTSCPTAAADTNNDGHIDIQEAEQVVGPIITPLDGNINLQLEEYGYFPQTDPWGAYVYSRTASFATFLNDLNAIDDDANDNIAKVPADGISYFEGKVVLLQGVDPLIQLPDTVATQEGLTPHETLPVACGIIKRVTHVPGVFEPDDITVGQVPSGPGGTVGGKPVPGRPDTYNRPPQGRKPLKPGNGARRRNEPKTTSGSRGGH